MYCVKISLHERCWLLRYIGHTHKEPHTYNGFSKLVEPLLQACLCFLSHSINYVAYRYQQSVSRCITCQVVYVQQSHAAKRL